ncbi:transmembrane protein 119b [Heterodontus francisci]|uniref:transmembrane protein 119b n=1 Tax=Heterodontus francisci TaxID=7792 RepID=UPI00355C6662
MAVSLVLWLLVLTSVCPSTTNPISSTDVPLTSNSAESSGAFESDNSFTEVSSSVMETSETVSYTAPVSTSKTTDTPSKPASIGAAIMEFINQHMILIIIAGVILILLIVIVCTVVLVKQNYKASAYYPSSYPKKKYVDEQDKRGSTKTFDEIPEKVNDNPKEEVVSSSKQLEADILTVTHNLKKKTPSKGEADIAENGEPSQKADKEGGSITSPGAGAKEGKGQTSDTIENKGSETDGKVEGNEKLAKGQKGGEGRGNKENDDEEGKDKGTKKKSESGEGTSTNSDQLPAGNMSSKSPKATLEQTTDAAETKGVDNVVSPDSKEPKEVKLAQPGLNEASNVAEPSADVSDLEKTPLIPTLDGMPSDTRAF